MSGIGRILCAIFHVWLLSIWHISLRHRALKTRLIEYWLQIAGLKSRRAKLCIELQQYSYVHKGMHTCFNVASPESSIIQATWLWLSPGHRRMATNIDFEPLSFVMNNTGKPILISGILGRFNIKMSSYQYRKPYCGDQTIVRSSYLHNGIFYTGQMATLNRTPGLNHTRYWYGSNLSTSHFSTNKNWINIYKYHLNYTISYPFISTHGVTYPVGAKRFHNLRYGFFFTFLTQYRLRQ